MRSLDILTVFRFRTFFSLQGQIPDKNQKTKEVFMEIANAKPDSQGSWLFFRKLKCQTA
jgi:hypothetical protein